MAPAPGGVVTAARLRARVRWWQRALQLEPWRLVVRCAPLDDCAACCEAEPEYLQATITVDPAQVPPEDLEATVAHELAHLLIWPLAHLADTMAAGDATRAEVVRVEEERLATALERIVTAWVERPPRRPRRRAR